MENNNTESKPNQPLKAKSIIPKKLFRYLLIPVLFIFYSYALFQLGKFSQVHKTIDLQDKINQQNLLISVLQKRINSPEISSQPTPAGVNYSIIDTPSFPGWKTYTNLSFGFRFNYPQQPFSIYTDNTSNSDSSLRAYFSSFSMHGDGAYKNTEWLMVQVDKTDKDINTAADNEIANQKGYVALKKENVTIGGIPGYELSYDPFGPTRSAMNDAVAPTYEGLVKKDNLLYTISYFHSSTSTLTKVQFNQMLLTMAFLSQTQTNSPCAWKTYSTAQYTLQYPGNWFVYQYPGAKDSIIVSDIPNPQDIPVSVSPEGHQMINISFSYNSMPTDFPYMNGSSTKNPTINSIAINSYQGIRGAMESTIGVSDIVFLTDPKGGWIDMEKEIGDISTFNQIVNSIHFL